VLAIRLLLLPISSALPSMSGSLKRILVENPGEWRNSKQQGMRPFSYDIDINVNLALRFA
jgi:hypothetical protein